MKKISRFYLLRFSFLLLACLANSFFVFAKIEIINPVPSSGLFACNGSVELQITADKITADESYELAGPFRISYFQTLRSGLVTRVTLPELYLGGDPLPIENLCNARYDFVITNVFGCESSISETLGCSNFDPQLTIVEMTPADFKDISIPPLNVPDSEDGRLVLQSNAENAAEFTYEWNTGETGLILDNVKAGNYRVTVTHGTCTSVQFYTIESCHISKLFLNEGFDGLPTSEVRRVANPAMDFEIKVQSGICGPNQEVPTLKVLIKEPFDTEFKIPDTEYEVKWNGELSMFPHFFTPNSCDGNNSVRVTNSCNIAKAKSAKIFDCEDYNFAEVQDAFIRDIFNPCTGFSDGGFSVEVPNPNNEEVTIIVGDFELISDTKNGVTAATISDIGAGLHQVDIYIGDCYFEIRNFRLDAGGNNLEYVRYDLDDGCYFEEYCGDRLIDMIWRPPTLDVANATGGPLRNCAIPVSCGDQRVGIQSVPRKLLRAHAYNKMLSVAQVNGFPVPPGFTVDGECQMVSFCPVTLNFRTTYFPIINGGREQGDITPLGNGCEDVDCGTFSYETCDNDFLDLGIPGFNRNTANLQLNECRVRRENFYQVYLEYMAGDFENDEIFNNNTGLSGLMAYLENPANQAEIGYCSDITYCQSSYEVLFLDRGVCTNFAFPEEIELSIKGVKRDFRITNTCQLIYKDDELEIAACRQASGLYKYKYFDVSNIDNSPGQATGFFENCDEDDIVTEDFNELYLEFNNNAFDNVPNFENTELYQILTNDTYLNDERRYCASISYCEIDYHAFTNIETVNCENLNCDNGSKRTKNFHQLYLRYKNNAFAHVPNFESTDLYKLLTNQTYLYDERRYCATITYCKTDYRATTDLTTIECERFNVPLDADDFNFDHLDLVYGVLPIYGSCDPFYRDEGADAEVSICRIRPSDGFIPDASDFRVQYYFNNGDLEDGFTENSEILDPKAVIDTFKNEELVNFCKTYFEDRYLPQGLLSNEDNYQLYNYNHLHNQIKKLRINHTKHAIERFESNFTFMVEVNTTAKEELVYFVNEQMEWTETIKSDSLVDTKHISIEENQYTVAGCFRDSLMVEDSLMTITPTPSAFLLRYDSFGFMQSSLVIENLDTNLIFSENQNGDILMASRFYGDSIIIDGVAQDMGISNGIVIVNIDVQNEVQIRQIIASNELAKIIGFDYSKTNNLHTLALSGADSISVNNHTLLDDTTQQIVLITLEEDSLTPVDSSLSVDDHSLDIVSQFHTIPQENINTTKFDLAYDKDDNLFVGLTFTNQVHLFDQTITSNGLEDIALLKINTEGNLEWSRTYGSVDNENVSQLMVYNPVVYFGGEFDGLETARTIGNYRFLNLTNSKQRAYISYVFDEIPNDAAVSRTAPTPKPTITGPIASDVKVYPNPFSNTFMISFDALQAGNTKVIITDVMGKEVLTLNYDTQIGKNELPITELEAAAGGVYYIGIHREAENLQSSHKIIHIK